MSLFRSLKSLAAVFGEGDNIVREAIRNQRQFRGTVAMGAVAIGVGALGLAAGSDDSTQTIAAAGLGVTGAATIGLGYLNSGRRLGQGLRLLDREASNMRRAIMGQTGDVTQAVGRVNRQLEEFAAANEGRGMSEFRRRSLAAREGFGTGNQRVFFGTAGEQRVGYFDEGAAPRAFNHDTGRYEASGFLTEDDNGSVYLANDITPQEFSLLSRSRTAPIGRDTDRGIDLNARVERNFDLNEMHRDYNRPRLGTAREIEDERRVEAERVIREELNYGNSPEEIRNFSESAYNIVDENGDLIRPRMPVVTRDQVRLTDEGEEELTGEVEELFVDPRRHVGYAEFVTDNQGRNIGTRTNEHFAARERELTEEIASIRAEGRAGDRDRLSQLEGEYRDLMARRDFINNYRGALPGQGANGYLPDESPNGIPDYQFHYLGNENELVGVGGRGRFPEQRRLGTAMDEVLGGASRGGSAGRATYLDEEVNTEIDIDDMIERENENVRRTFENRANELEEQYTTPGAQITEEEYHEAMGALHAEYDEVQGGVEDRVREQARQQRENAISSARISRPGGGNFLSHALDFVAIPGMVGSFNAIKEGIFYKENERESPFIGRFKAAAEGFGSGASTAFLGVAGMKGIQGLGRLSLLSSNPNLFEATGGFFGSPSIMQSIDRGAVAVMGLDRGQHPAFGSIPGRMNQAIREGSVSSNLGMLRDERAGIQALEGRINALTETIDNGGLTEAQATAAQTELTQLTERAQANRHRFAYNSDPATNPGVHVAYGSMDEFGGYEGEFGLALSDFPTIAATYMGGLAGGGIRSLEMAENAVRRNAANNNGNGTFFDRFKRTNTSRLEMSARDADVLGIPEKEIDLIGRGSTLAALGTGAGAAFTLGAAASSYGGGIGHPINAYTNNYGLQASAEAQMQADASERIRMMNSSMIGINDISENYYVNPGLSPTRGRHRPGKYNDDGSLVFALSNLRRG